MFYAFIRGHEHKVLEDVWQKDNKSARFCRPIRVSVSHLSEVQKIQRKTAARRLGDFGSHFGFDLILDGLNSEQSFEIQKA